MTQNSITEEKCWAVNINGQHKQSPTCLNVNNFNKLLHATANTLQLTAEHPCAAHNIKLYVIWVWMFMTLFLPPVSLDSQGFWFWWGKLVVTAGAWCVASLHKLRDRCVIKSSESSRHAKFSDWIPPEKKAICTGTQSWSYLREYWKYGNAHTYWI